MRNALITVVKVLKTTDKAHMVLAYFGDPSRFTMVWLPKSQVEREVEPYWGIPFWLRRQILDKGDWFTSRKYHDDRFGDGIELYAYGTESTGFFTAEGDELDKTDLIDP